MKNRRKRITNLAEMDKMYQDGVISRTTLWRAKKRGWCSPYWQEKEVTSDATKEEMMLLVSKLYKSIKKKSTYLYSIYGKREDWSVCDDMAHDAIEHIILKKETKYPLHVAGTYMKHYLLSGRYR